MDKKTKQFLIGDIFAINGKELRGHFVVLFDILTDDNLLFVDTLTGTPYIFNKRNTLNALKHKVGHPKHDNLTLLDYIENLPKDVFEVIKANVNIGNIEDIEKFEIL